MILNLASAAALLLASGVVAPSAIITYSQSTNCGTNVACQKQGRYFRFVQCSWKIRDVLQNQGIVKAREFTAAAAQRTKDFGADYGIIVGTQVRYIFLIVLVPYTAVVSVTEPPVGSTDRSKPGYANALAAIQAAKNLSDNCSLNASTPTCLGYMAEAEAQIRTLGGVSPSSINPYGLVQPAPTAPTSTSPWGCDGIQPVQVNSYTAP
jgi:hypothetical protein